MYRLLIVVAMLLCTATAWAEEETVKVKEVVISATKIEESVEQTTSSVLVVNEEQIKAREKDFAVDVLKDIPEINVAQNGGPGKQATVILRGASSDQIIVLIDGVKVKSTTLGTFDFGGLTSNDIERIEVVKGPQSTIYGSEAMGGVINIITKKGEGDPKIEGSFESGSFNTFNISSTLSGGTDVVDYRITGNIYETAGISTLKDGTEKDGYGSTSMSAKIGIRPIDALDLEFTGRVSNDRSELDDRGSDNLVYVQTGNKNLFSAKGSLYLFDMWEQVLLLSHMRDSIENRDTTPGSFNNSDFISSMQSADWQHNLYFADTYTLVVGGEYRKEAGESIGAFDKSIENRAVYLNNILTILDNDLTLNAGLRYDDHETFGDETTYKVGAVYNIRPIGLSVKGSYGTGFRAPTINQLYYTDGWGSRGNPDLDPEKSSAWEIGLEKKLAEEKVTLSATYFSQEYDDLIEWIETPPGSWTYQPQNISDAEIKGVEASATFNILDELAISAFYAYLDTENEDTGERLQRRPDNKYTVRLDYSEGPLSFLTSYTYVDSVYDAAADDDLPSYSLVDLSGSYKVSDNLAFFGRVDNLFNEDYEVTGDFNTPGISVYAGVRVSSL